MYPKPSSLLWRIHSSLSLFLTPDLSLTTVLWQLLSDCNWLSTRLAHTSLGNSLMAMLHEKKKTGFFLGGWCLNFSSDNLVFPCTQPNFFFSLSYKSVLTNNCLDLSSYLICITTHFISKLFHSCYFIPWKAVLLLVINF